VKLWSDNNTQNFDIVIPQMKKISSLIANVGHKDKYKDRTVYNVYFSSPEYSVMAVMDSIGGRLYSLDFQKTGWKVLYSKDCPDTTELFSLAIAEDIKLTIPKSNILCNKMIEEPLKVKYLKANITVDFEGSPRTKSAWQNFDGKYEMGKISGTVEVKVKRYKGSKSWELSQVHDVPQSLAPYLSTTPEVPAHNEVVKKLSEKFSGKTIWEYAENVNRWLADRIRQTPGQSDALIAAAEHKGDPLARARLFASIMRTRGIPARVVGGLYYFGQVWVPHYWDEVWVSPSVGWRPVDPSTGEDRNFSAVHITIFEGSGSIGSGNVEIIKLKKR